MKRLILVRHGETDLNARGHYVSESNPPLNQTGRAQVLALAQTLQSVVVDTVFCSPKLRCVQTAEALTSAQPHLDGFTVDDRLVELGFGEFDGRSQAEIANLGLNDVFEQWRQGSPPAFPSNAETFEDAASRMAEFYRDLMADDFNVAVVVGHSHALRILIATQVMGGGAEAHRRLRLDHAGVADIFWEGRAPRLAALNAAQTPASPRLGVKSTT